MDSKNKGKDVEVKGQICEWKFCLLSESPVKNKKQKVYAKTTWRTFN